MSSRDRKRADRRKRKQRSSAAPESAAMPPEAAASADAPQADEAGAATPHANGVAPANAAVESIAAESERRGVSKSEIRNERAREGLEPLDKGERPGVVTIGALVSFAIALSILIGYVSGAKVSVDNSDLKEKANAFQVFPPLILFVVMGWGMWGSRYWAVLGFEAIMAIIMVGSFIVLVAATSAFQAISALLVLVAAGALFWFTVKALARIQMPSPSDRSSR